MAALKRSCKGYFESVTLIYKIVHIEKLVVWKLIDWNHSWVAHLPTTVFINVISVNSKVGNWRG